MMFDDQVPISFFDVSIKSTDQPHGPPGLLSSTAPVGWWTWDPSELLADPTTAQSRWVPLIYKRTTVVTGGGGDSRAMTDGFIHIQSFMSGNIGKCWDNLYFLSYLISTMLEDRGYN